MKKLQIEYIDQSELHLNDENVNVHPTKSIEKIAKSIEAFGFINPVIIDEHNIILAGHGRVMAAKEKGINKIPCIRVKWLSDEKKIGYMIADNAVKEFSFLDQELLAGAIEQIEDVDLQDLLDYDNEWEVVDEESFMDEDSFSEEEYNSDREERSKIKIKIETERKEECILKIQEIIKEKGFLDVDVK